MKYFKMFSFILFSGLLVLIFFFLPMKDVFTFTETRTTEENVFYIPIGQQKTFEIRYVHSIHLTDVIESYEVTKSKGIRLKSMSYENLAIGMPGEAGEGETIQLKDGVYTLTYTDKVIDSFRLHIGRVDAGLAFRYKGIETDLKAYLERGKSYEFEVQKMTLYQLMKGEELHDKR